MVWTKGPLARSAELSRFATELLLKCVDRRRRDRLSGLSSRFQLELRTQLQSQDDRTPTFIPMLPRSGSTTKGPTQRSPSSSGHVVTESDRATTVPGRRSRARRRQFGCPSNCPNMEPYLVLLTGLAGQGQRPEQEQRHGLERRGRNCPLSQAGDTGFQSSHGWFVGVLAAPCSLLLLLVNRCDPLSCMSALFSNFALLPI